MVEITNELILATTVVAVWFLGGYSITGFIEHGNGHEMSYNQTIKVYLTWPLTPIKTFFFGILGLFLRG